MEGFCALLALDRLDIGHFLWDDWKMKRLILGLLAFSLLAVENASGQVQYTVTDLGALPGYTSFAYGINNSGQVVGDLQNSSNLKLEGFSYSNGTMQALTGTTGAYAINKSGQIVGGDGLGYACLYSGGTMLDLGTLLGDTYGSGAYAINDKGQIVGDCYKNSSYEQAFLYIGGTMTNLGTLPGGSQGEASGINYSGQICGSAVNSSNRWHAILYSGGTMHDLGTLPGDLGSFASAINNSGQIVGYSENSSGIDRAFLYSNSNGSMQPLGTLGGATSVATDINNLGVVVGWSSTNGSSTHPFVYADGVMEDLDSLIAPSSGWILGNATGINDNGQICGTGTNPSGQTHAFLLTPTPEPSTLALLGVGAMGLIAYVWRRRRAKA